MIMFTKLKISQFNNCVFIQHNFGIVLQLCRHELICLQSLGTTAFIKPQKQFTWKPDLTSRYLFE